MIMIQNILLSRGMLDVKLIRQNPNKVKEGIQKKKIDPKLVDKFLDFDEKWRILKQKFDELKAEQKKLSKEKNIEKAKEVKNEIKSIEKDILSIEKQREESLEKFPNLPFEDVPVGKDENDNVVIREVGKKPNFDFPIKDYFDIAQKLDLIDTEQAAKVSGSRFAYLKKDLVLLEFALVKLAFDILTKEGFIPIIPPVMIKPEVFKGMGRVAGEQKEERYYLPKDNLYLVGSAEHTIGPFHMNEVFNENELPKRYIGFSTCFRREAGSYGKDVKGILRVHQFDKVEMFSFVKPENSENEHQFLLSMQEKLMQALKLPYRVVEICTGDMGFTDARQFDIETWLPGQNKYRETHSCSNTTDFQARGINVRYKDKKTKELKYVHMLNATAFAIGRTIIAILENYQQKDGSVMVPEVLREYLGKEVIKNN